jgi:hypothetical protein
MRRGIERGGCVIVVECCGKGYVSAHGCGIVAVLERRNGGELVAGV